MPDLKSPDNQMNSRARSVGCSPVLEIDHSGTETENPLAHLSGQIIGIEYKAADLATDANFTITFLTMNDVVIHAEAAIADNTTAFVNLVTDNVYIPNNCKMKITSVTSQTNKIIEVILHLLRG